MIRISKLDHVVIRAHNADAMCDFYCDVLGCSVERTSTQFGLTQLRAGDALIDIVAVDGELGRLGFQGSRDFGKAFLHGDRHPWTIRA